MNDSVFHENAGRFLKAEETQSMKDAYHSSKLACGHKKDEYTRSEFFGLNRVNLLLKQPGCVGIRIHYANRWEDENGKPTEPGKGKLNPRVVLTGVDARGRDLPLPGGLKDDGGDGSGGGTVGDGPVCPRHCADTE